MTVAVQRRSGRRWATVGRGRAAGAGVFVLTLPVTSQPGSIALRVAALKGDRVAGVSRVLHVRVTAAAKSSRGVVVSPQTQVLDPTVVSSAPAPGAPGTLTYAGGNAVGVGQIIAIGQGPHTPQGFLGRVTSVSNSNGQTIVSTQPATLLDAVPTGSLNATLTNQDGGLSAATRRSLARVAAADVSCQGSASASVKPTHSFGDSVTLVGHWRRFGGLQDASLTANAHGSIGLAVHIGVQGSCTLPKTPIAKIPGPGVTFFIGWVPFVVSSTITVYVEASAAAQAAVDTSITAKVDAHAGIGWIRGQGFYPIKPSDPTVNYVAPTLSASASIGATLSPTINVLVDGIGGPEIVLSGGLDLNADIAQNPWWALTAPVKLTAGLSIPDLNLSSPTLTLYDHTFTLDHAAGAFGGQPPQLPPPPPQLPPPPPQLPPPPPAVPVSRHIQSYTTTSDLECSVQTQEDAHDEFFGGAGGSGDACGTFLAVSGTVYGPMVLPAGSTAVGSVPWTPVSASETGSGTTADPYVDTTVVAAGTTGVQLTETDTWSVGGTQVGSAMTVDGPSGTPDAILYRAGDCYVNGADFGTGAITNAQVASCIASDGTQLTLTPQTPGAASMEGLYTSVWSNIGSQTLFPGTSDPTYLDNGVGTSWDVPFNGSPVTNRASFALQ